MAEIQKVSGAVRYEVVRRPLGEVECYAVDEGGARRRLGLRLDLARHSPTGFEYGYGGSGPAQLALAVTADLLGDAVARSTYQDVKAALIATAPHNVRLILSADAVSRCASEALERAVAQLAGEGAGGG